MVERRWRPSSEPPPGSGSGSDRGRLAEIPLEELLELQRILADAWDEPRLDWARTRVPPADPQLVDAPRKLFLHAGDGQPLAVVLWSNDRAPELVARGQRTAAEARERLGPTLGSVILHPLAEGRACGSSFVVLPWCGSLAERGVLARIQRLRLRAPLLRWLRETAARTRAPAEPSEIRARLRALAAALDERSSLRRPLEAAFDRLEGGQWRPSHALDHNDLWLGNVMRPPPGGGAPGLPFVLIDWVGANLRGTGFFDLLRIAPALGLGRRGLRREVLRYAVQLGCEPEDAAGQLLAALGRLALHREAFPLERYRVLAERTWARFHALGLSP